MPLPLSVSLFSKIQIGFTFLVLVYPGSPRQKAIKRVCVCMWLLMLVSKVPLMWSEPHFYNADSLYQNAVHGLTPNKTLHESVVIVEPVSVPELFVVKAVRGMNVQICTKASNLVHRYILTCWTQICREPKPIFTGVAILDDSKWPPSENTFLHFWPTNSHRITNKTTFLVFLAPRNPILICEWQ